MTDLHAAFERFKPCVLHLVVRDSDGKESSGTCFHIGDGFLVTARHCVEDKSILWVGDLPGSDVVVRYHPDPRVDLALLATPFRLQPERKVFVDGTYRECASAISIGGHLDDWLSDDDFVLQKALVMGYPPIPQSNRPVLVATEAEVSAVIDKYTGSPHPHFVLSSIPRGGFSGGPVLMFDALLGVVTESLVEGDQALENGYAVALTVEPLLELMGHHRIFPSGWNGDWARELVDGPGSVDDDWLERSSAYLPPPLPYWFRWRRLAYRLTDRRPLRPLNRRLHFHARMGASNIPPRQ